MELELENHYVIGVVVFMTVLLCCKNVLEFLQLCVHLSEKCVLDSCCVCPCLYYNHKELLVTSTLVMITVCSIGQPIILLVCNAISQHLTDDAGTWTVKLLQVQYNKTDIREHFAVHNVSRVYESCDMVKVSKVDAILIALPFALFGAASAWVWFNLKLVGFFDSDPLWDMHLFEDPRMRCYEVLYTFEIFCLIMALSLLCADPAFLVECLLFSGLTTAILLLFFACSRSELTHVTDQWIATIALAMICMLTSVYVSSHWTSCASNLTASLFLALGVPALGITHMQAGGNWHAGSIIMLRSVFSCVHTMLFSVFILVGPDQICA